MTPQHDAPHAMALLLHEEQFAAVAAALLEQEHPLCVARDGMRVLRAAMNGSALLGSLN